LGAPVRRQKYIKFALSALLKGIEGQFLMSSKLNQLHLLGISYRKSDFRMREKFAIDSKHYAHILHATDLLDIEELFILSTCNRTEYYVIHPHVDELIDHLSKYLRINFTEIKKHTYHHQGVEALRHFFSVASGLDSQILGDQEIVSQIKDAVQLPRKYGKIGNFMERMINTGLNASRLVKRNTSISNGSTSVAHAAVSWIRRHELPEDRPTLLIGAGQIGRAVAYNFSAVLPEKRLFIT
jgi:glutamyl-tRNA reductase